MWRKRINVAVIVLTGLLVVGVGFPMIQRSRETARRMHSMNNLKQIGIGIYNYHDVVGGYPPGGTFSLEGRALHGWPTFLLPQMTVSPLYCSIDFNQPWDSSQNAGTFLNRYVDYENPGQVAKVGRWEFAVTHYSANPYLMADNSLTRLKFVESRGQVFLVGELAADFLPWGCPYNWRELNGLNSEPPTYGRSTRDGCQFLFVDGRVKFVANEVSPDILKSMNGEDLTGFKTNSAKIQRPASFPCPTDAIWLRWEGQIQVTEDVHGNIKRTPFKGLWSQKVE